MKKTKTLLIIATASLVLMIIIALVMSIVAIKTANKRPISLEQIVIQSHDIEFCAKYADRCGMFFNGIITSEDTSRKFFLGKNFYTTSANKISRGFIEEAVLDEDIILAIGGREI